MKPAALGLLAGVAVGGAVAAASRGRTLVPWPGRVRPAFPFVVGGLVGTVAGLKVGVGSSLVRAARGTGPGPVTTVAPVLVGAGLVVGVSAAGTAAAGRMLGRLDGDRPRAGPRILRGANGFRRVGRPGISCDAGRARPRGRAIRQHRVDGGRRARGHRPRAGRHPRARLHRARLGGHAGAARRPGDGRAAPHGGLRAGEPHRAGARPARATPIRRPSTSSRCSPAATARPSRSATGCCRRSCR